MAHKIFNIPEILELILLHTETRTLLLSQRVCRLWLSLISHSSLQIALFFKPSPHTIPIGSDQKRTRNPLFEENLWPQFLRKQLPTCPRRSESYRGLKLPVLDLAREQAYLRPEASWGRMLFQQPPSPRIGFVEYDASGDSDLYTYAQISSPTGDGFLRMRDLVSPLDRGVLMPGQDKWVFWFEPIYLRQLERKQQDERAMATSTYLNDCEFVVFVYHYCDYIHPRYRGNNRLTAWLDPFGKPRFYRGHYLQPIWAYD